MHFIRVAEVYHIFLVSSLCPIVLAAVVVAVVVPLAANKDMCVLTYMHCRFCRYRANNAAN